MKDKIRVLYLIQSLAIGGQEKQIIDLINNLNSQEIECRLISLSKNVEKICFLKNNIKIYTLKTLPFKKLFNIIYIFRHCKTFKPNIIHGFDAVSSVYAGLLGYLTKSYMIGGFNGSFISSKILIKLLKLFANFHETIVCNSYAGFNYLKNSCKIPEKKLKVIENGFDFKAMEEPPFEIPKLKDIIGKEISKNIIGLVGKLNEDKDPMVFVKAAEIVYEKFKDVSFCFIGDGPYKDMVSNYIKTKGMENYFYLVPKRIEAPWLCKEFSIGTLSSKLEGLPNVLLEYMYWEKPIVATKAGDCSRVILDGKTGFVVEIGDFRALAEKLIFLLENPEKAKEMGKAGRKLLEEKYKVERFAKDFSLLYKNIMQKKSLNN